MNALATEVAEQIIDQNFNQRMGWIEGTKTKGNDFFKKELFDQAIDEYYKCLMGLDFNSIKSRVPPDAVAMADVQVKVPVLNNMSACLGKKGQYSRAVEMIGEVLKLDEFNAKAWLRKLNYLEQQGDLEALRKEIKWVKLQPSCHDQSVR